MPIRRKFSSKTQLFRKVTVFTLALLSFIAGASNLPSGYAIAADSSFGQFMGFITPTDVAQRIQWLASRPQSQLQIRQNGMMYWIDRTGLHGDTEIIQSREPLVLYHFTSINSAELFVEKQLMIVGKQPYLLAIHGGSEMIYNNYVDVTGLFFTQNRIPPEKQGYTGASNTKALLRVTLPPGFPILKMPSLDDDIPFFVIPAQPGQAVALRVERL